MNILPKDTGVWFQLPSLPLGISEQEISDHFAACGFDMPAERISVREFSRAGGHPTHCGAIVSLPQEFIADLLEWALSETPLRKMPVRVQPFRSPRKNP